MKIIDTIKKQLIYGSGNLTCEHSKIEPESFHEDVYENEKYITPTGKYVCTKCGKEFSPKEYEEFIHGKKL